MEQDLFKSLRTHFNKISSGEKSPAEMASSVTGAVKDWVEESGEVLKARIESEIEGAAERRGFVRQVELEAQLKLMLARIEELETRLNNLSRSKKEAKRDALLSIKKAKL
jgi:hypothetical protein